ncbi:MAG: sugar phosphate isomerase/epimerase [Planctomycetota bacterium]|nr:MAG: sugar phosphate isomerase/epimerase [Planctomycetota bacterium]
MHRRDFLLRCAGAAAAAAAGCGVPATAEPPRFRLSLAQWSLHRALQAGELTTLDFPARAAAHGLEGVEYVNSFFKNKADDESYLSELRRRCEDAGVRSVLIMCDGEGELGAAAAADRRRAVENHHRWVRAAAFLGCHAIRVNAGGPGGRDELAPRVVESLRALCDFADPFGIDVIVENHGGWSSDGGWLAGVLAAVDHPRCGALPDFGNFRIDGEHEYDRYRGVAELMPFARGVSAKSYDFDPVTGEETTIDYGRMLAIVLGAGYHGFIGIEYEGRRLTEDEGIRATRRLLERYRTGSA